MKYRGHHKLAGLIMMLMMIGNWEEEEKHNTKENWSLEGVFDRYLQNMVLQFNDPKTTKLTQLDNTS